MTKKDLAKVLAAAEQLPQTKAVSVIDNIMDFVTCHFQEGGDKVTLRGFGTFLVRRRRAFTGRDPRNGSPVEVGEKFSVFFRPSAELLRRIN